ncbi:DUF4304 domain-containing protein [Gottfriedia acidiceleris]|uniref:DUF4304 domain-containing protein n=1 Tax=Gottfriedia acidiceleris TaxID=371036 RepID=UPI002F266615
MISSPEINKIIRKILTPSLKEHGFTKTNTRNNWGWHNHSIWVLNIEGVGSYFSNVTGWTPMSIHVEMGIYYDFVPPLNSEINIGNNGELLPKYYQCHFQKSLNCNLNQSNYTNHLDNPAERERKDIWWIETDGLNVEEVIVDIKQSFLKNGLEWLRELTNVNTAFTEIEKGHDSYNKFYKARYFAEHLNEKEKLQMYTQLMEQERKRIGL